jgi:hypothetical protein
MCRFMDAISSLASKARVRFWQIAPAIA